MNDIHNQFRIIAFSISLFSFFVFLSPAIEKRLKRKAAKEAGKKPLYIGLKMGENAKEITHKLEVLFLEFEENNTAPGNLCRAMQEFLDELYKTEELLKNQIDLLIYEPKIPFDMKVAPRKQDEFFDQRDSLFELFVTTTIQDPDGKLVKKFKDTIDYYAMGYIKLLFLKYGSVLLFRRQTLVPVY